MENETKIKFETLMDDLAQGNWIYTMHEIYADGRMVVHFKLNKLKKQNKIVVLYKSSEKT